MVVCGIDIGGTTTVGFGDLVASLDISRGSGSECSGTDDLRDATAEDFALFSK